MRRNIRPNIALCALILLQALATDGSTPSSKSAQSLREEAKSLFGTIPEKMPGSEKDSPELVKLGQQLFFEKRLSENKSMSCNTCHAIDGNKGGVDNEATSLGVFGKRGDRNSPTVLNAGLHTAQFWDGRAATLEDQAKGPVLNPVEMAMPDEKEVLKRLNDDAEYKKAFGKIFKDSTDPVTYDNVAKAIAAFERTLITKDRFDDFQRGDDSALSPKELKGLETFMQVGCATCHHGPLLGGNTYQKMGLVNPYENTKDEGRFAVTKDEDDKFKFKVPSLRNIALTHPYFHDGKAAKLKDAVQSMAWLQLGKQLTSEEVDAIVAFLNTLTDKPRATKSN